MGTSDQPLELTAAIGAAVIGGDGTDGLALNPAEPGDHLAIVRRAAAAEQTSRVLLQQAVGAARGSGHSWAAIGAALGLSRQGVQQRFGSRTAPEDTAQYRWLGPVTAFDEMPELEMAAGGSVPSR